MQNHKLKTAITTTIIIVVFTFFVFFDAQPTTNNSEECWWIENNGQSVNGMSGKVGIDLKLNEAWKITTGKKSVIVAVVDSGYDTNCNNITLLEGGKYNYNFVENSNVIFEDVFFDYHGTYICECIAANDNELPGIAPNITVLPLKFMEGSSGNSEDMIRAIQYACDHGAKIVNCSFSMSDYSNELYEVIYNHPNVTFVCAAGNENLNLDCDKIYPASFDLDNVISVTAIDSNGIVYNYAGYGTKVTVAAPGVNIKVRFSKDNTGYIDGTSVATAMVTGICSLMLSVNENLTPLEIKEILVNSSTLTEELHGKCSANGYINAFGALLSVLNY